MEKEQLAPLEGATATPMQEMLPEQTASADPAAVTGLAVEAEQKEDADQAVIQDVLDAQNQESGQEQILAQITEQPSVEPEGKGMAPLPLILAGAAVIVAVIAAIALVLVRRGQHASRGILDETQVEERTAIQTAPATAPVPESRAKDPTWRTQAENAQGMGKKEPPAEESGAPIPRKEDDVPQTEIVNQHTDHPRFAIGRGATIGGREEQQDSFYCSNWTDDAILSQRGLLVAVADGIGGLKDGALASSTAMAAMQSRFATNAFATKGSNKLLSLVAAAQSEVLHLNQNGHHCGCTLVTVLIEGWDLHLASVGDSRIYLYRAGGLITLNREHTLRRENEDQAEFARLSVSPDNLRKPKAITSYLGKANIRLIDRTIQPMKLLPGDKILLMSDGVFGTLNEDEMIKSLRKAPETAAKEMIDSIDARRDPRQDNATVVVIAIQ